MDISIKLNEKQKVNDILKCIGLLAMVIDHIGAIIYPHILIFRIVGRIAFPIYAYYICNGYSNTSNLKKYLIRLFSLALISQPVYNLTFVGLNTIFTLLAGIIAIDLLNKKKILGVIIIILMAQFTQMDYGGYGIITILAIYTNIISNTAFFIVYIGITILFNPLQIFSLIFFILLKANFRFSFRINQYISYIFYPLHIFILHIIFKFRC